MSSMSLGCSLLPSTIIIALALVNSAVSPVGTSSISTRPRSAPLLPVSTASTGLLCLLVGACVHHVRSDTEKYHMWLLPCAHHFQCVTHIPSSFVNNPNNKYNPKYMPLTIFNLMKVSRLYVVRRRGRLAPG